MLNRGAFGQLSGHRCCLPHTPGLQTFLRGAVHGRGCRCRCTVFRAAGPAGRWAGAVAQRCMAGDGGSAQRRCSSGGRRRGESGKPRGAELSTQTTMQHPCTSLQRAGAPLGCSWEASPPPAERGRREGGSFTSSSRKREEASPPPLPGGLWFFTDAV